MTKRPYVSFAEVKEKVSISEALAAFGLFDRFQQKGDSLTGVCPLPEHKHGPSPNPEQFKVNRRGGLELFHCFGNCGRGGDVIELVKAITGYDNAHVRFWFAEHFGDRLSGTEASRKSHASEISLAVAATDESESPDIERSNAQTLEPLRFRLKLDSNVDYLRVRGLTGQTIARFGLGLCTRGLLNGYVAIPVYRYPRQADENPVAYLGRWPGEDYDESAGRPRYKWPDGFAKSQVVYGLAEALDGTESQPLIVVEGPFKVYYLVQAGFPHTAAIFGSALSDEQARLLIATKRPIVLLLDGDEAGRVGMAAAVEKLIDHAPVRRIVLPGGQQPDSLSAPELVALFN